jgi:hypothetical protein
MGMPGAFAQTDYAFYLDGSEVAASIIGTQNNQQTLDVDTNYQIRLLIQETGGSDDDDQELPVFEYELNTSTVWNDITESSSVIQAVDSNNLTDGGDTTSRLTGGSGTFITPNAWVTEDGNLPTLSYVAGEHCEALLSCQIIGADVSNGDQILVRLNGSPNITYTATADIDVAKEGGDARRRSNVT